jgi:hypothetical protein
MKKMNLNSLELNKKNISNFNKTTINGGANDSLPLTKCKLDSIDTATLMPPIPNPDDDPPL